ncbi:MAG: DoxX family membrane protein [Bifidobacteriaceae bacterium]|nr:DoxX family membrane protein [Bifidobacteriaceae bacterium]
MTTPPEANVGAPLWARLQPWLSLVVRLGLAVVTVKAALPKLRDLRGSGLAVGLYQIFPTSINQLIGVALPIVELALGVVFVAGLLTRYASVVFGLMQVAFIAGIASAWARGLNIDCGCFAVGTELAPGTEPAYAEDILRDIGFLAMAAFLVIWPRSVASLDNVFGLNPVGRLDTELIQIGELDEADEDEVLAEDQDGRPEEDPAVAADESSGATGPAG